MANIYRGLNIELNFADILNNRESLSNLGLNLDDIDLINGKNTDDAKGLSAFGLDTTDIRMASGLNEDQRKSLYSLNTSSQFSSRILADMSSVNENLLHNIRIDDQIRASAIKYNFYDYATDTERSADISTSRVSSWSEVGIDTIFYGGEVEVIAGGSGSSNVSVTSLGSNQEVFEKLTFFTDPADEPIQPTHTVTLNIGGVNKNFYAVKGIPLQFDTFFRNANTTNPYTGGTTLSGLYYQVQSGSGNPVWRIVNKTDDGIYDSSGSGLDPSRGAFPFFDGTGKSRTLEFYYNPEKILQLGLPYLNISSIPPVVLSELNYFNLTGNDLYEVPDFATYAPKIETVILNGNNLSRARDASDVTITANTQLQSLSTATDTLKNLYINGCFSDSETIDVSTSLPNLEILEFDALFGQTSRRMNDTGVSPIVPTTIKEYKVRRHLYTECANNVCQSTTLEVFDIYANNIAAREGNNDLTLASNELNYFRSYSNPHNLVDISGKNKVTYYEHSYSYTLRNDTSNDINNIFDNLNTALQYIVLIGTYAYGTIDSAFQNLPALRYIDLRDTKNSGSLNDNSFSGSPNIENIYIERGNYNSADFFGVASGSGTVFSSLPKLSFIITRYNNNIQGELPVLSDMPALRYVYIHNTGVSGNVPSIEGSGVRTLYLANNSLTGSVPSFNNDSLIQALLFSNQFTSMSAPVGSNLSNIAAQNNNIAGDIPDMSGAPKLQKIRLQNNQFTGYTPGAIATNKFLSIIDFSGNNIGVANFSNIVQDLVSNYVLNPRTNVTVNLSGNGFTLNDLTQETLDNYNFLLSKWTITI